MRTVNAPRRAAALFLVLGTALLWSGGAWLFFRSIRVCMGTHAIVARYRGDR